jgi:aminoglycoside phosphotransferase (APT) family kinase protein
VGEQTKRGLHGSRAIAAQGNHKVNELPVKKVLRRRTIMADAFHEQRLATYKTSKEDLASIVKTVMDDEIAELIPVKQGYANEVHSVTTKRGQEIIVRIQQQGVTGFEQEAWAMSHARSLGVGVPEVFDVRQFEIAGQHHDVMVLQKVNGKPLSEISNLEPPQLRHVCKQLGLMLEKLRNSTISGFGFAKGNQAWEFVDWQGYVDSTLEWRQTDAPSLVQAGLSENEVSQLLGIVGEIKSQEDQKPVLCHGDIGLDHLFVNDNLELVSLIDWGLCQGGSHALDVAVFLMYNPDIELSWIVQDYAGFGISEMAFKREMLIWQANTAMGFLGHNMREGNEDYKDIAVFGMRSMLETWQSM